MPKSISISVSSSMSGPRSASALSSILIKNLACVTSRSLLKNSSFRSASFPKANTNFADGSISKNLNCRKREMMRNRNAPMTSNSSDSESLLTSWRASLRRLLRNLECALSSPSCQWHFRRWNTSCRQPWWSTGFCSSFRFVSKIGTCCKPRIYEPSRRLLVVSSHHTLPVEC